MVNDDNWARKKINDSRISYLHILSFIFIVLSTIPVIIYRFIFDIKIEGLLGKWYGWPLLEVFIISILLAFMELIGKYWMKKALITISIVIIVLILALGIIFSYSIDLSLIQFLSSRIIEVGLAAAVGFLVIYSKINNFRRFVLFLLLLSFFILSFAVYYQALSNSGAFVRSITRLINSTNMGVGRAHLEGIILKTSICWLYSLPFILFILPPFFIGAFSSNFQYPVKYLSSIFGILFHESSIPILIGLLSSGILTFLLPVVLSDPEPPTTVEAITLLDIWIGSFILWIAPLFMILFQFETKFEENFDRELRSIIQGMKKHTVVIGYGNLGRDICIDLFERRVVDKEKETCAILAPDLEVLRICKSLLVVDSNDQLFDRVHRDPILEDIGVTRINLGSGKEKDQKKGESKEKEGNEDILIPAIIGDIKSEATRDGAKLKDSRLFISATSNYAATFSLSKFANSVNTTSIVRVSDSSQKDYFSPKMTAYNSFFVYPALQEGISLGKIISLCYLKLLEKQKFESDSFDIVIAGRGKQIVYLIETFWIEMDRNGKTKQWTEHKKCTLPMSVMTDDEKLTQPKSNDIVKMELIYKKNLTQFRINNSKEKEFGKTIRRSARIDDDTEISVNLVFDVPSRLKKINKIINEHNPKIIVVTTTEIENISKIFHEWVLAVERQMSKEEYKPIIIAGVLGSEHGEIRDILLYYSDMAKFGNEFPIHYLDSVVRIYDDSAEQISGLAHAFAGEGGSENPGDAFALYFCLKDVPGVLAHLLGKLADIKFEENKKENENCNVISLRFFRYQNCPKKEFYLFSADAELRKREDVKNKFSHYLFQGKLDPKEKKSNMERIRELLGNRLTDLKTRNRIEKLDSIIEKSKKNSNKKLIENILNKYPLISAFFKSKRISDGKFNQFIRELDDFISELENTDNEQLKSLLDSIVQKMKMNKKNRIEQSGLVNSIGEIKKTLERKSEDDIYEQLKNIRLNCSQRVTCPVFSYLRKTQNLIGNREHYELLETSGNVKGDKRTQEIKRFIINKDFSRGTKNGDECDIAKGIIALCCRSDEPGSLAIALNNLLLQKISDEANNKKKVSLLQGFFSRVFPGKSQEDNRIADIKYITSNGCYGSEFSLFELYGSLVKKEKRIKDKFDVINLIIINPVTEKNKWLEYAKDLLGFLGNGYEMRHDECLDIIAIKNEDFEFETCEKSNKNDGERVCSKKDCPLYFKQKKCNHKYEK